MKEARIFGLDYDGLLKAIERKRGEGSKIVMCSGTFDLFHIGHMKMIDEAKKRGDVLIVAVKSNKAAALKKKDPPVMTEKERLEAVAHYGMADYVVMVDYDSKMEVPFEAANKSADQWLNMFYPLISTVKPDIFVHEDSPALEKARKDLFTREGVIGLIHPRTEGISSTEIIRRIESRRHN